MQHTCALHETHSVKKGTRNNNKRKNGAKTANKSGAKTGNKSVAKTSGATKAKTSVSKKATTSVSKKSKTSGDIDPEDLTFRAVMHNPRKYLQHFIKHWCEGCEDLQDGVEGMTLTVETLQQKGWRKKGAMKNVSKLAHHRFLPGLCRTHANKSFDFCVSMNLLPVIYSSSSDPDESVDMVKPFTVAFWCCYCNLSPDEPPIQSEECQMVSACNSHATHIHISFTYM